MVTDKDRGVQQELRCLVVGFVLGRDKIHQPLPPDVRRGLSSFASVLELTHMDT